MRQTSVRFRTWLFAALVALLVTTQVSAAQTSYSIRVNTIESVEDTDYFLLNVFFTIVDQVSGTVVTNASLQNAEMNLLDTKETITVPVAKPDTPIYIAMVLDTSGSMGAAADSLRKAATAAVDTPPENAQFAVISFNEKIDLLLDFHSADNKEPIERAIGEVQPVYGAGTCLYDAAYSAITELQKAPPGRRAVVLFTDGVDETRAADGTPCSRHTYTELIKYATQPDVNVPIHTIGLAAVKSRLNTQELANMALATGGSSAIGSQDDLEALFKKIMDALKSQWLVQAKLYPTQGNHDVLLKVRMSEGNFSTATVSFTSTRGYTAPPPAAAVKISGSSYDPEQDAYVVNLQVTSPQLLQNLSLSIWDEKTGEKPFEQDLAGPKEQMSVQIPMDRLEFDREYQVEINGVDMEGQPLANDQGAQPYLTHKIKIEQKASLQISAVSVDLIDDQPFVTLNLASRNIEAVTRCEFKLNDMDANKLVPGFSYTLEQFPADGNVRIPMEQVPAGKYSILLDTFGENGRAIASTRYDGLVYSPPPAKSLFQKIGAGIQRSPWILAVIALIFVGVIAFLVVTAFIAKRMTGTPVLQRELNAQLGQPAPLPLEHTVELHKNKPPSAAPAVPAKPAPIHPGAGRGPDPIRSTPPPASAYGPAVRNTPGAAQPVSKAAASPAKPVPAEALPAQPVVSRAPTNAAAQPIGVITIQVSPDATILGRPIEVSVFPFTIGRTDCRLTIQDPSMSRLHAQISYQSASRTFTIQDLSRNGILVSGQKIPANTPVPLPPGTIVSLGPRTQARFEVKGL